MKRSFGSILCAAVLLLGCGAGSSDTGPDATPCDKLWDVHSRQGVPGVEPIARIDFGDLFLRSELDADQWLLRIGQSFQGDFETLVFWDRFLATGSGAYLRLVAMNDTQTVAAGIRRFGDDYYLEVFEESDGQVVQNRVTQMQGADTSAEGSFSFRRTGLDAYMSASGLEGGRGMSFRWLSDSIDMFLLLGSEAPNSDNTESVEAFVTNFSSTSPGPGRADSFDCDSLREPLPL